MLNVFAKLQAQIADLQQRLDALELKPPAAKRFVERPATIVQLEQIVLSKFRCLKRISLALRSRAVKTTQDAKRVFWRSIKLSRRPRCPGQALCRNSLPAARPSWLAIAHKRALRSAKLNAPTSIDPRFCRLLPSHMPHLSRPLVRRIHRSAYHIVAYLDGQCAAKAMTPVRNCPARTGSLARFSAHTPDGTRKVRAV